MADKANLYRAYRIHELLGDHYWTIRPLIKVQRAWIEMDMLIHEIINELEKDGPEDETLYVA